MTGINTTRAYAKSGMRKSGATSDRPEEKLAARIILSHMSCVRHFSEQQKIWLDKIHYCKPDISFMMTNRDFEKNIIYGTFFYIIRVNGPWHDERVNEDFIQKCRLEEKNSIVIDFSYKTMPMLFLRNKRKLSLDELHEAYVEIKMELKKYKLELESFNPDLLASDLLS